MSRRRRLNIKKLKYPLWLNITFSILTIVAPILLIVIESLKASADGNQTFRLSFTVIATAVVAWTIIYKIVINKMQVKLIAKQALLEHDYSTENGNIEKIEYLWRNNEIKLTLFSLVNFVIYGGLTVLILIGVSNGLIRIRILIGLIVSTYILAYGVKFMYLILRGGLEEDLHEEDSGS